MRHGGPGGTRAGELPALRCCRIAGRCGSGRATWREFGRLPGRCERLLRASGQCWVVRAAETTLASAATGFGHATVQSGAANRQCSHKYACGTHQRRCARPRMQAIGWLGVTEACPRLPVVCAVILVLFAQPDSSLRLLLSETPPRSPSRNSASAHGACQRSIHVLGSSQTQRGGPTAVTAAAWRARWAACQPTAACARKVRCRWKPRDV